MESNTEMYMLFLYDGPPAMPDMTPQELQGIIEQYRAWSQSLEADGRLVDSNKLTDDEGRVLRAREGEVRVLDGPFSETKEVIGGYFAIRAGSWDEAVEVARGCPHLGYGGTIEVRRVDRHPVEAD